MALGLEPSRYPIRYHLLIYTHVAHYWANETCNASNRTNNGRFENHVAAPCAGVAAASRGCAASCRRSVLLRRLVIVLEEDEEQKCLRQPREQAKSF